MGPIQPYSSFFGTFIRPAKISRHGCCMGPHRVFVIVLWISDSVPVLLPSPVSIASVSSWNLIYNGALVYLTFYEAVYAQPPGAAYTTRRFCSD